MANLLVNGNFEIKGKSGNNFKRELLDAIYPIGIVVEFVNGTNPNEIMLGQKWEKLPGGRCLWSIENGEAGGPIDAGLPNITGQFRAYTYDHDGYHTGAFDTQARNGDGPGGGASNRAWITYKFNAASSSSIYKDSVTTVQPPAIKVYMWKRTS